MIIDSPEESRLKLIRIYDLVPVLDVIIESPAESPEESRLKLIRIYDLVHVLDVIYEPPEE